MIAYSVIVPTYNRSHLLPLTLDSLLRQTVRKNKYEIIIVDDGSTDGTMSLVKRYIKRNPSWKIIYIASLHKGPAAAKNIGIKNATGSVVFFTDDDCIVFSDWMQRMLEVLRKDNNIVGVGGWSRPSLQVLRENKYVQFHFLLHRFFYGFALDSFSGILPKDNKKKDQEFYPIITANVAYRKKILQKIGAFDEKFPYPAYEDLDLNKRLIDLGYKLYYLPFLVIDKRVLSFNSFLRLCFLRTHSHIIYFIKHYGGYKKRPEYPWVTVQRFSQFLKKNKTHFSDIFPKSFLHILLASLWFTLSYSIHLLFIASALFKSKGVSISKTNSLSTSTA